MNTKIEGLSTFPEPPVGKKWVMGNYSRTSGPLNVEFKLVSDVREDGTPLSIVPLPEVEGYRVEYYGEAMQSLDGAYAYISSSSDNPKWDEDFTPLDEPNSCKGIFYARLYKIAQPTTLADLVGEDGQRNFYTICRYPLEITQGRASIRNGALHTFSVNRSRLVNISEHIDFNIRWSHSPFTTWEEANEFIPE